MLYENILLSEELGCKPVPLTAYIPDVYEEIDPERVRPAIVLCPGGGYRMRSRKEAEPIALRYVTQGINVFVLEYSVAPDRYPTQLKQIAAAVAYVRRNAAQFHTDPDRIFVSGFSAGGHLSANLGVTWTRDDLFPELTREERRPNGMILCYPRITYRNLPDPERLNILLGEGFTPEQVDQVCLDELVNANTPPAFIWHTFEDQTVLVDNPLKFALALAQNQIPCELHIFQNGPHGLGLADDQTQGKPEKANGYPECRAWIDMAIRWAKGL